MSENSNFAIVRQCKAMLSNRTRRCNKPAMQGQLVCEKHGGKAPQSIRAARVRTMRDLYHPMLARLAEVLETDDLDAILKACAIISRQYLSDGAVHHEPDVDADFAEWLTDEELAQLQVLIERAQTRRAGRERAWEYESAVTFEAELTRSEVVIAPTTSGPLGLVPSGIEPNQEPDK